jgi:hypothetical protein
VATWVINREEKGRFCGDGPPGSRPEPEDGVGGGGGERQGYRA